MRAKGERTVVDERTSPSTGWREVYERMGVATEEREEWQPCPECGTKIRPTKRHRCPLKLVD